MKILPLFLFLFSPFAGAGVVGHDIRLRLEPEQNLLEAEDSITMPEAKTGLIFSLHKGLSPVVLTKGASLTLLPPEKPGDVYAVNYSSSWDVFEKYSLSLPKGTKTFKLKYGGRIAHPPAAQEEDYARGFSETPGLISPEGCYLSGSTFWYPEFDGELSSFKLETDLPEGYESVAGGDRTGRVVKDGRTRSVWKAAVPQDEITLACGKYKEYADHGEKPELQVFLREADEALAQKYLTAARQYVEMYAGLIGPYPYGKFALVENFWETGYGVASFTLLGPKIIRFPFILNSSYPHEILHNWWGNGVFVDYEKGNWCEGLTAYLADYLISEGRGKGAEYRMAALQKYADYVRAGKDFPLRGFQSRRSPASEAVGYGKSLMFYHMLRTSLGDVKFKAGLRDFYRENKFRSASFDDLKRSFEKQTGKGRLDKFFHQWVDLPGAPELALRNVKITREAEGFGLEFEIVQLQDGPAYQLEVPVYIQLENISRPRKSLLIVTQKEESFKYSSMVKPARIAVDPEFDLFRKLDPLETPPTLSRLLGAAGPLLVLPAAASSGTYSAYETFAAAWPADKGNAPELRKDSELSALPKNRQIWIFGNENRFYPELAGGLARLGARLGPEKAVVDNQDFPFAAATMVFAGFNPGDPAYSAGLILTDRPEKLRQLAAKLPHYGKYGYLVFDAGMAAVKTGGWNPDNSASGQCTKAENGCLNPRAPLTATLGPYAVPPVYPAREPLAAPVSVFSADRMKSHAVYLASELEGRGSGETGLEKAYRHIGKMFLEYGLKPFFDGSASPEDGFAGTRFAQEWEENGHALRNLAGVIEGSGRKDEYVVVSAHYDHLPSEKGKVYPGANDNASGIALLFELAGYYSKRRPSRTIVFAAFDGEERGRLGSRHFIKNLGGGRAAKINADINLDSVGRLDGGKMLFLNSGSSDKWTHILRGAGFVTGLDYEASRQNLDSSDQASFIEAGIPAVQLLSGINADYHKFSDTAEKLDYAGMVKEAEFLKEIIDYLAGDSDLITRPPGSPSSLISHPSSLNKRTVSTGLIPSFEWQGKGVKADSVAPGSPLSATEFRAGDVVTRINGIPTDDLRSYSRELGKHVPGDKIKITYLSDGLEKTAELELTAK
ncbi:MAG TPA: hypothetical protein DEF68_07005 [Elusimicrobia bacterium]|nr:hypothetical protein [Elusimicrobiota bacterium]